MATLSERKAEYNLHEPAGRDYYNTLRSQITLDIESGARTLTEALSLQQQLMYVGLNLHTGDWRSALVCCDALQVNSIMTQTYLDDLKAYIQNYITTNYSW